MATYTHSFRDYAGARAAFEKLAASKRRPKERGWTTEYKIGHNTYLGKFAQGHHSNHYYYVRYHNTPIVRYGPGLIEIQDGGWDTPTTRERVDEFSPIKLHRDKGTTLARLGDWDTGTDVVWAGRLAVRV